MDQHGSEDAVSKCICDDWTIQKEEKPGDFHDPRDRLPKGPDGLKTRVLHFGCPVHAGHSNRRRPPSR